MVIRKIIRNIYAFYVQFAVNNCFNKIHIIMESLFFGEPYISIVHILLRMKDLERIMENIWISNAIIDNISSERGSQYVTVVYREQTPQGRITVQTVRLVVTNQTRIYDEYRRPIRVRDLEEGMIVNALISAAMTRSIPPQAQAFQIFVVQSPVKSQVTEGRILQRDTRNRFIVTASSNNLSSAIQFNIGSDTEIFDLLGRRIRIEDLFPGLRVRVEHAPFMTASIPPQTTAFVIRVIR